MIQFKGSTVSMLDQGRLTPSEVDALERATGLSMAKVRRLGATCVCDHGAKMHRDPVAAEGELVDTSCKVDGCGCEAFEPDMPARVTTALLWLSIRRTQPAVKFSDVSEVPYEDMWKEDEVDAVDPTDPPQAEASPN